MATARAPSAAAEDYTGASIQVKKGVEHVRARPAMYIGDVYERGLHHLVNEVVDNSVDEHMAGHCTQIDVTIHQDGSLTVLDDGRGIPVDLHEKEGIPTLEVCLTILGAGGKFDKDSYSVSGGLHGVGVSCVNALSEWMEAEVYREGVGHRMRFERGVTVRTLEELGPTKRRGTKITFLPDKEIFRQTREFKYSIIAERLKELAYLNAGLKIQVRDERGGKTQEEAFCFPNGIAQFVQDLSASETQLLVKPIYLKGARDSKESGGNVEVEIAIQYNDTYSDTLASYANNINTVEGGTHLTGFRTALTATFNNWLKDNEGGDKDGERPTGDDYREGLVAIISVKVPEPQFEGQTKTKLGNSDVGGIVQTVLSEWLKGWCEQNPAETKKVVQKALQARTARLAAKKAKDLARKAKNALTGGGIAKLKECNPNTPAEECELYLVEGDSAGGTATQARDTNFQAILPLRGKILNVWKSTHDKMLAHNEIANLIQALGTGILDEFDLAKLQYHKIVIMCDADVDGSHIRTLILTFFFRQMPTLISAGHVYIAQPPLYKVRQKGQREEQATYFLDQHAFDEALLGMGLEGTSLVALGRAEPIAGAALARLAELTAETAQLAEEVEVKGVPLPKYVARAKEGRLPFARIAAGGRKAPAVYSQEELDSFLKTAREAEPDLKVWYHTDPLADRAAADVEVTTFTSKRRLEEIGGELERLGFAWGDLFPPAVSEREEPPPLRFALERGKERIELASLLELPAKVRAMGQRGADVQRYKGLGEMDRDELEETTMKPGQRRLLRVTLENMAQANQIFSVLMGTKVEPRREFIERHALDVSMDEVDA